MENGHDSEDIHELIQDPNKKRVYISRQAVGVRWPGDWL
jgi:hypothetical protein